MSLSAAIQLQFVLQYLVSGALELITEIPSMVAFLKMVATFACKCHILQ